MFSTPIMNIEGIKLQLLGQYQFYCYSFVPILSCSLKIESSWLLKNTLALDVIVGVKGDIFNNKIDHQLSFDFTDNQYKQEIFKNGLKSNQRQTGINLEFFIFV